MSQAPDLMDRAQRLLELGPVFQQWAVTRVQRAETDQGLSLRQYAALHAIRQGATSPGALAQRWQVTPAVLTGIIDRLERREMVRREPDPADRRRLRLVLTEAGLTASRALEQVLANDLAGQLATASPDDLAALDRSLALLHRTLSALRDQVEHQGDPLGPDADRPVTAQHEPQHERQADDDQNGSRQPAHAAANWTARQQG